MVAAGGWGVAMTVTVGDWGGDRRRRAHRLVSMTVSPGEPADVVEPVGLADHGPGGPGNGLDRVAAWRECG
jgi:hypothetical protein